jgi:antirestriction protein ArdC
MTTRKPTKNRKPRRDVEAEITARVIEALEAGTVPWQKPWTGGGILPTSATTGRAYRGINVWLLSMTAQAKDYASPYWLTFNQAQAFGGSVRKGERGTLVVFWKILEKPDRDDPDRKVKIPLMRHYTVFNLEQTDDVTMPPRFAPPEPGEPVAVDVALTEILDGYADGPTVKHARGDSARYNPATDTVTLPELDQFESGTAFAATALHELAHSTGHATRLDRFTRNGEPQHFGTERYAREELVAEMGSAMLAASAGIETSFENTAAYVQNWLGVLKGDTSLVIQAAQQAQRAIDRITGTSQVKENGEEQAA